MRLTRTKIAALAAAVILAACGGGEGAGDQNPRVAFSSLVSFGDSLSDVGTYRVGTVAAVGGGKFTVNGPNARNWTEWIASNIKVAAPCPAQTGLLPNIPGLVGAPVTNAPACTNYAQGSARVSNVFAPNSASLQAAPFSQVNIGLMALPVNQQLAAHLAKSNGKFSGTELVTVMAGGNDAFMNINGVSAAAAGGTAAVGAAVAAGWPAATQQAVAAGGAAAVNAAATAAVTTMGQAGAELAGLVQAQVLAKGAKYVVVVNLPDVSQTPSALLADVQTRGLINQMVTTFNAQLAAGLAGTPVVLVDAYSQGRDQTANPAQYSLTNVTTPACSTTSPANPFQGSSLGCTSASTVQADVSGFLYADSSGHPTPFGYQLLAQFVGVQMAKAGWL
jgi:phospholipase/lecithinase/hemolysin